MRTFPFEQKYRTHSTAVSLFLWWTSQNSAENFSFESVTESKYQHRKFAHSCSSQLGLSKSGHLSNDFSVIVGRNAKICIYWFAATSLKDEYRPESHFLLEFQTCLILTNYYHRVRKSFLFLFISYKWNITGSWNLIDSSRDIEDAKVFRRASRLQSMLRDDFRPWKQRSDVAMIGIAYFNKILYSYLALFCCTEQAQEKQKTNTVRREGTRTVKNWKCKMRLFCQNKTFL